MINLGGDPGLARDGEEFIGGLEQPVPFAAEVRDVNAVVRRGDLRQRDQLFGLRVEAGRVDQSGGDSERAFLHRLTDESAHSLQLRRRRRAVGKADLMDAHGRGADKGGDIR